MVPNQFGTSGQMVPRIFRLSRGTGCGDLEIRGPNWLGTICPAGPNFWGPFVHGDRIWWGPFVQWDQFYGDRLSRGTGSGGPEVRGSNGFGTKSVAAFNLILIWPHCGPHRVPAFHNITRQMSRLETFYGAKPLFCQFGGEKLVWLDFSCLLKSRVVSQIVPWWTCIFDTYYNTYLIGFVK